MIQANCFIVADELTRKAIVIDPGGDAPVIAKKVEDLKLDVVAILATHGHFDHVEGLAGLKEKLHAPVMVHEADMPIILRMKEQAALFGVRANPAPQPDRYLTADEEIVFGNLKAKVIHTPGHSPGSVSFLIGSDVFVGDLLFQGSIGRTDLYGGDYDQLLNVVRTRIFTLPPETVVHPGHGPDTSVGREMRANPFFR